MLGDDVDDQTRPPVEGESTVSLSFTVVLEEVATFLPILEDTVHQFLPHPAVDLPDALMVPVVQSARPEDHVVDGQPHRSPPVVVQSAILAIPQGKRPDSSLGKQLLRITYNGH